MNDLRPKPLENWNRDDLEPRVRVILDRTVANRPTGPYSAKTNAEVVAILERFYDAKGFADIEISGVRRMAGGASKEQFGFTVRYAGAPNAQKFILRMDPLEGIAQTCRGREAQLHNAMIGVVPVAAVRYADPDGEIMGQPGMIMDFVNGVTQPTDSKSHGVSGIGSRFDDWAPKLAPQFLDALVKIHAFDWSTADLSYFEKPAPDSTQAALWQVNAWSRLWRNAVIEPVPMITFAERWLRENLPVCKKPVVCHCDLRIGNFMFEEPSGRFTAILDWELGHIGDFHEDIAWAMQRLFGVWREDGVFLISGLMPRDYFMEQYQALSGNVIDPKTLRFYEVLNAYKCAVMDCGQALRAAQESNNHQDILITWLGAAGSVFLGQLVELIEKA